MINPKPLSILPIALAGALTAAATDARAQSNEEKLRSMAQFYGVATYALGANERCDLLDQGEYRGLIVLRDALARDLSRATTAEIFASLNHLPTGMKDWDKGCLSRRAHGTEWGRIDRALLIAHAVQAAPAAIASDPATCAMDDYGFRLPRSDWKIAAATAARHHGGSDRTTFEGLQKMFAGLVEADCARASTSRLMQAGFDTLWHVEDNAQALPGAGTSASPGSSLAGKYQSVIAARKLGSWRLRHGPFTGDMLRDGLNSYRLVERGDGPTAFMHLTSAGLFGGPAGQILLRPNGGWAVHLGGNAAAVAARLSDGTNMPLTKVAGSGSAGLGSARFELPTASVAALADKADATEVQLAWQDGDGKWTPFLGLGRKPEVQKFTLGQLRQAIAWATVPRPE